MEILQVELVLNDRLSAPMGNPADESLLLGHHRAFNVAGADEGIVFAKSGLMVSKT
jgi:hypothetical protein